MFDYKKIYKELISDLPDRTKDVLTRRFGIDCNKESLEAIGRDYGITRERVRQIERSGFNILHKKAEQMNQPAIILNEELSKYGGFKKEDVFLSKWDDQRNEVSFFLTAHPKFHRYSDTEDYHSFWTNNPEANKSIKLVSDFCHQLFRREKRLIGESDLPKLLPSLSSVQAVSALEVAKRFDRGPEGLFGLREWPEIKPKGVKDKAYITLKKEGKPLHFREVATLLKTALPQTVHNELIKDNRFVLVGRGIYALTEWGYFPGEVKDVMIRVIQEEGRPMTREEIAEKVLQQRMVKKNTIFQNLSSKRNFSRTTDGRYTLC
jgi:hypothetical protein